MILIDSSCWVEFYRVGGDADTQHAVAEAVASGGVATCGIVRVEVCSHVVKKADVELLQKDFSSLVYFDIGEDEYHQAILLGRALRSHGFSAPATDLIIAAVAIRNEALLLHRDRHFESIARHSELKQCWTSSNRHQRGETRSPG